MFSDTFAELVRHGDGIAHWWFNKYHK